MQYLHDAVEQFHNKQRTAEGSFWANRFYSTRIQAGGHLGQCLLYIDLNMIRAKVVEHSVSWNCCGHHELLKPKIRYRIVNRKHLLQKPGMDSIFFLNWYVKTFGIKLKKIESRQDYWTKVLVVGNPNWLKSAAPEMG